MKQGRVPWRDPRAILKTQQEKARKYRGLLVEGWSYTPDGKTYPMVMVSYWSWAENASEQRSWGGSKLTSWASASRRWASGPTESTRAP